eukprot:scaffold6395_cov159-Amphora_coffeaeformis.AAC.3
MNQHPGLVSAHERRDRFFRHQRLRITENVMFGRVSKAQAHREQALLTSSLENLLEPPFRKKCLDWTDMSFFSWGSQHNKDEDLPTGAGGYSPPSHSTPTHNSYDDEDDRGPPLSATGPPPTSLGYQNTSPQPTEEHSPPLTYYNHHSTPRGQSQSSAPPAAAVDSKLHIFVPKNKVDSEDFEAKEEEEDGSWMEASPVSESPCENDNSQEGVQEINNEPVLYEGHHYNHPPPNEESSPIANITDNTTTEMSQNIFRDNEGYNSAVQQQQQEDAWGSDEWEEIDEGKTTNTGPATLETVPITDQVEEEPHQQATATTGEFEWIHTSAPSEELITETNITRHKNPESSSAALVVPRGLPPFTKGVKTGLNQLQEKTMRRQQEVRTRIHAVECQMAQWTANLAHERMNRHEALQHILAENVYQPAGVLAERVSQTRQKAFERIDRFSDTKGASDDDDEATQRQPRWRAVEARLSALETQMAQSTHALAKQRREKMVSSHDRLIYDILPRIWQDRTEAAAQESVLLEQVDQLAATCAARSLQECATRQVVMQLTDEYLHSSDYNYEERHEALSKSLDEIRAELKREAEARRRQDEKIHQQMIAMTTALRNAMLEAVGDPED